MSFFTILFFVALMWIVLNSLSRSSARCDRRRSGERAPETDPMQTRLDALADRIGALEAIVTDRDRDLRDKFRRL